VLPLHRYQPAEIAGEVERLGIDPARRRLGIGSGALSPQIDSLQRETGVAASFVSASVGFTRLAAVAWTRWLRQR
jgi:hypothetical protein